MQDILINCSPRETRVAVLIDGILEDLHIERVANRGLVGNVYMGRVLRVLIRLPLTRKRVYCEDMPRILISLLLPPPVTTTPGTLPIPNSMTIGTR